MSLGTLLLIFLVLLVLGAFSGGYAGWFPSRYGYGGGSLLLLILVLLIIFR